MINGIKVIDAHVHCAAQFDARALLDYTTAVPDALSAADVLNINAVAHSRAITLTPTALALKMLYPGRVYAFGCPDVSEYYLHAATLGAHMAEYGAALMKMGCDGIKLLEGKPQMRKKYPVPAFDAPVWDEFWEWAEAAQTPILWHVNDPENFWDAANAPAFAVQQGWLYDESYVNNEAQYAEVLNVLKRHPRLNICFAHFFFMSAQLERLDAIMDRYENVRVDITPGIELYENLSRNIGAAKEFFERRHDRIMYGTDIGGRCVLMGEEKALDREENKRRGEIVMSFLTQEREREISSDGHFLVKRPSIIMRPLALEGERLREIVSGNFERFAGVAPKRVDKAALEKECARLRERMAELACVLPGFVPDYSVVEYAESVMSGSL